MRRLAFSGFIASTICFFIALTSGWLLPSKVESTRPVEMLNYESALWLMVTYLIGFWCMVRVRRHAGIIEGWMLIWAVIAGAPFVLFFSFFWLLAGPFYLGFLLALIVRLF